MVREVVGRALIALVMAPSMVGVRPRSVLAASGGAAHFEQSHHTAFAIVAQLNRNGSVWVGTNFSISTVWLLSMAISARSSSSTRTYWSLLTSGRKGSLLQ